MRNLHLWWQLKVAGVDKQEQAELMQTARKLNMGDVHLSGEAKDAIAEQIGFKPVHLKKRHRLEFAGAFALFLVLTVGSIFAQPGSPLYAVKRSVQDVRALVQPSYKQELEKERELEQRKTNNDVNDDRSGSKNDSDDADSSKASDDSIRGDSSGKPSSGDSGSSSSKDSGSSSQDSGGSGSSDSNAPDSGGGSGSSGGSSGSGGHSSGD